MSSVVDPQPELPEAEELVAYLDGELSPEECRRVEERLARDPEYRQRLRELDEAWEALAALPAARANDDFARTTMELVTVAAQGDVSQHVARAAAVRRRRAAWMVMAGVAAAVVGFIAAQALWSRTDAALLADLPVIRQADLLRHVDNVEFLRRLPAAVPLEQLSSDTTAVEQELQHLTAAGADSMEARRKWVASLPPEEKAQLAAQAKRFEALSRNPAEQQRLRDLHDQIARAGDAERLQRTLIAYGQWLSRLTPGEQEGLRAGMWELPADEQVKRVAEQVRQADERSFRRLTAEEAERLRHVALEIAAERRPAIAAELRRREGRDVLPRLEGPRGALLIVSWEAARDGGDNPVRERLLDQLTPERQAYFDRLRGWERRAQLWRWVRDALQPSWGPGELEQFFTSDLDNNERERLLNLPTHEMRAELERMYLNAQFPPFGPDAPGSPRAEEATRPGPRDGPPPPDSRRRPRD